MGHHGLVHYLEGLGKMALEAPCNSSRRRKSLSLLRLGLISRPFPSRWISARSRSITTRGMFVRSRLDSTVRVFGLTQNCGRPSGVRDLNGSPQPLEIMSRAQGPADNKKFFVIRLDSALESISCRVVAFQIGPKLINRCCWSPASCWTEIARRNPRVSVMSSACHVYV